MDNVIFGVGQHHLQLQNHDPTVIPDLKLTCEWSQSLCVHYEKINRFLTEYALRIA